MMIHFRSQAVRPVESSRDANPQPLPYQEREVDGLIATLLGILQPLLLDHGRHRLIVLAVLMPIFEINDQLH
jgi:hypothetical protein